MISLKLKDGVEKLLAYRPFLFCHEKETMCLKKEWLTRKTVQFHWKNMNYESSMIFKFATKKKKKIKSERKKILEKKLCVES